MLELRIVAPFYLCSEKKICTNDSIKMGQKKWDENEKYFEIISNDLYDSNHNSSKSKLTYLIH